MCLSQSMPLPLVPRPLACPDFQGSQGLCFSSLPAPHPCPPRTLLQGSSEEMQAHHVLGLGTGDLCNSAPVSILHLMKLKGENELMNQ